jgi:hypothetical protein
VRITGFFGHQTSVAALSRPKSWVCPEGYLWVALTELLQCLSGAEKSYIEEEEKKREKRGEKGLFFSTRNN